MILQNWLFTIQNTCVSLHLWWPLWEEDREHGIRGLCRRGTMWFLILCSRKEERKNFLLSHKSGSKLVFFSRIGVLVMCFVLVMCKYALFRSNHWKNNCVDSFWIAYWKKYLFDKYWFVSFLCTLFYSPMENIIHK